MAGKRRGTSPVHSPQPMYSYGPGMGAGPGGSAQVEKFRDRTPTEVITDGYMGVVQIATLNAVTQMGMESLRQCDLKRHEVLAEHPNLEAPITGLLFNHARLVAEVQNGIVDGANGSKRK